MCAAFLRELRERGLQTAQGLLGVIDGAKGLRKALQTVFGAEAVFQRCQWHKRENVLEYVPKSHRESLDALVGQRTARVDRWPTSGSRQS